MCRGLLVGLTITSLAVGAPLAVATPAHASGHIKDLIIAVQAPLTGELASLGKDMLRGVRLAASQVNAKGGVLGMRVKLVPIDDKGDPAYASSSVKKAQNANATAVIGIYNCSIDVIDLLEYLTAKNCSCA